MKIYEDTKYLEARYRDGSVQIYEGLTYKQPDIIKMCDFYSLSRYMTGQRDEMSRDKPFYNVVNFRVTLAKTATEFDIKDFVATSDDDKAWVQTMLINREAYKWMKESRFSTFLNKYAYVRPKYGSVLYKKTLNKDGELRIEVCDWRNVLTDQVNIIGSPIIEKHYMTPLDLYEKKGVWNNVDEALELFDKKRQEKGDDEAPMRLEVWEVTGVMSEEAYREATDGKEMKEGEKEYSLQKHFMLYDCDDEENEIVFYSTKPKEFGYRCLAWEEVPGRGMGRGIIEDSEEGQVWVNDNVQQQKNAMDLAGKAMAYTDSDKVAGNLLEVDDGKVFHLEEGKSISPLQLAPAALGNFQNIIEQWNSQMDKATSTYDANTGETMPSGTPYSQTALLNQVAQRPFAFRQEEAAIDLEEMWNDWVMPYLTKKIESEHLLAEDFDDEELQAIDDAFGNKRARMAAKEMLLNFEMFTQDDLNMVKDAEKQAQQRNGTKRTIKVPQGFFDDWRGKMTLNITNEQQNKQAILTSLSQILQTVSQSFNPQTGQFSILDNPVLSKLFGMIIDQAGIGISPIELGIGRPQQPIPNAPAMPQQAAPQAPMGEPSPVQPQQPVTPQM